MTWREAAGMEGTHWNVAWQLCLAQVHTANVYDEGAWRGGAPSVVVQDALSTLALVMIENVGLILRRHEYDARSGAAEGVHGEMPWR